MIGSDLVSVLFVDDEQNVLEGIRRQLRGMYNVLVATSGAVGLQVLRHHGVIPIVVSDMRMPTMNGADFLARVREESPDSVRLVLSGQSELNAAIDAVNRGQVFRFLAKPCAPEVMIETLQSAYRQYQLTMAERELLEKTLNGAVTLMTEIMAMVDKDAFCKAARLKQYVGEISDVIGVSNGWELKLAAMLSQIGCLSVPRQILDKVTAGQGLTDSERALYEQHPKMAAGLLERIPRLEGVAHIIGNQDQFRSDEMLSLEPSKWHPTLLGAQIVSAADAFDTLIARGATQDDAVHALQQQRKRFHPAVIDALRTVQVHGDSESVQSVRVSHLRVGMTIDEDVTTTDGMLLVAHGRQVTDTMLSVLRKYATEKRVQEPFRVRVPRALAPVGG